MKVDGRLARSADTHKRLIESCRALILSGVYQPTGLDIIRAVDCSHRTIFHHFPGGLKELHAAAIDDEAVRTEIAVRILPTGLAPSHRDRVVAAVVLGDPYFFARRRKADLETEASLGPSP